MAEKKNKSNALRNTVIGLGIATALAGGYATFSASGNDTMSSTDLALTPVMVLSSVIKESLPVFLIVKEIGDGATIETAKKPDLKGLTYKKWSLCGKYVEDKTTYCIIWMVPDKEASLDASITAITEDRAKELLNQKNVPFTKGFYK